MLRALRNNENVLLDMREYSIPSPPKINSAIPTIHRLIPRKGGKIDFDIYDFDTLYRDKATRQLMCEGNTIGCFYIESPGMRSLLKRLDCDTFEMLTAASSVIRPGVAESGMMQEFIERHKNPARRKYLVPEMEEHLGETYGVMIYQEDVIKVAHHIAGLTLEEADLLRRAMSGKMRSHDAMKRIKKRFFASCSAKKHSEKITAELWRQIESFAGYAFCKAHSASYAQLSFQVAYLKAHYPAEFMASVLNNRGGYYSAAVYIQECRRMGLKVLLPNVNESIYEYDGFDRTVLMGFMALKGLSRKSISRIITERKNNGKYMSLADFIVRTKIGYEETKLLIKCGAMDCFKKTRTSLARLLDIYFCHRKLLEENYNDMFASETFALEEEVVATRQYSLAEICAIEDEIFGYMVTRHPLHFFRKYTDHPKVIKAIDMPKYNGQKVRMVGWFMASKRIKTKKGDAMKFLSLEDLTGTFEAVVFPRAYAEYAELTMSMGPYFILGTVDMENGCNVVVEKLAVLSGKEIKSATQKDGSGKKWYGYVEKISEEEFYLVESLDAERLRRAHL